MGTSEHYCLRWNNHQNNLLGVFSQLLRDESLVDVTLACSEGHSIRAHRVVLSACSSYFQTLFVDHPSRHPIVILKDVRFAELRTLIEFMYRGEVNVEYCQLSALLKTAESLKVKGLAEMTNLSSSTTASASSITSPIVPSNSSSSIAGVSSTPTATVTSQHENPTLPPPSATSTVRMSGSVVDHLDQRVLLEREHLALRERERENRELHMNERVERDRIDRVGEHVLKTEPVDIPSHHQRLSALVDDSQGHTTSSSTPPPPSSRRQCSSASPPPPQSQQTSAIINRRMGPSSSSSEDTGGRGNNNDDGGGSGVISPRLPLDHHDQDSVVNLTTSSCSTTSTAERTAPSDLSVQLQTNNNNNSSTIGPPPSCSSSSSRIPSASPGHHHDTEPIAGPSGLPPVQQVPLSLKKEADWGGGMSDEKSIVESDYSRHSYDQEFEGTSSSFPCMYCGATFQHQSKLTRHILSHSLETLKYREQLHLQGLPPGLAGMPPEALSAFSRGVPTSHDPISMKCDPGSSTTSGSGPDYSAMDIDLEAAAAASAGAGSSGVLCKFCGKSFPDVGSLIAHLPAHTGDRPFKCEFCGKAFKLRHHMKDHCRVHTGERPFRCALCGKTFSRSTILKAHEKTHYPKYVRKFLSPSPLDTEEENNPHQ